MRHALDPVACHEDVGDAGRLQWPAGEAAGAEMCDGTCSQMGETKRGGRHQDQGRRKVAPGKRSTALSNTCAQTDQSSHVTKQCGQRSLAAEHAGMTIPGWVLHTLAWRKAGSQMARFLCTRPTISSSLSGSSCTQDLTALSLPAEPCMKPCNATLEGPRAGERLPHSRVGCAAAPE